MLSTKDRITLNHQKAFNIFAEIVNHGSDIIQHSPTNIKKIQKRKRILYFMVIASHCHIEAIFTLCKEGRTNSCWPLLRVVLENLINSKFLYTSRSHSSFDKFMLWGYKEQLKCFVKLKELSVDDEYRKQVYITILEIDKMIASLNKLISKIEMKITKKDGQDLLNRAKQVDELNKNKKKKTLYLQVLYNKFYRLFSDDAHLSPKGLLKFISIGEDGVPEFLLSGNPKDICMIVSYSLFIYRNMIEMFIVIFDNRKGLKQFREFCASVESKYNVNWSE